MQAGDHRVTRDITVRLTEDQYRRVIAGVQRSGFKPSRAGSLGITEFVRAWASSLPPAADMPPPQRSKRPNSRAYHPG